MDLERFLPLASLIVTIGCSGSAASSANDAQVGSPGGDATAADATSDHSSTTVRDGGGGSADVEGPVDAPLVFNDAPITFDADATACTPVDAGGAGSEWSAIPVGVDGWGDTPIKKCYVACCSQVNRMHFSLFSSKSSPLGRSNPLVPARARSGEGPASGTTNWLRGSGDTARVAGPVYCGASDSRAGVDSAS